MSVDSVGFSENLLKAVKLQGYKNLTPIQQQAIPVIRSGADLLASAQTGTGKTAAFALPILDLIASNITSEQSAFRNSRALILTPTRELAIQVADNIKNYCQFMPVKSGAIYGGGRMPSQTKMLKEGVDVLVATPGRLLEHLTLRNTDLSHIRFLVLDEADRMLDMGFLKDIEQLISGITQKHQTLMFSATFSHHVNLLAKQLLKNPKTIEVSKQNSTSGKVKQSVYWVSEERKRELLSEIIGVNNWRQVLVFAGTKESANILAKELTLDGIDAVLCHGDKSQGARNKALEKFTSGTARVLVATDVAARGLDIADLPYVVNFHLPFLAEDYVHRIGRTGRAGKTGTAISLVSPKDRRFLGDIEALIGRRFEPLVLPGYEFDEVENGKRKHSNIDGRIKGSALTKSPSGDKNRYRATQEKNQKIAKKTQGKSNTANRKAKKGR